MALPQLQVCDVCSYHGQNHTHNFSAQCNVLSPYQVDPPRDVPILLTHVDALYGVLEQ